MAQACDFIRQAALGLQHAGEQALVHRDIKPANLMVTAAPGRPVPEKAGPGAFQGGGQGGVPAGAPGFGGAAGGPNGGPGGEDVSSALTDYLVANRGSARWIVAVTSANQAGSIELATGLPVMAMGGFSGTDPAPTLAQLQADIASGELRFVIVGGGGGPGGGQSEITDWVIANCTPVSSVSANLYDCAGAVT